MNSDVERLLEYTEVLDNFEDDIDGTQSKVSNDGAGIRLHRRRAVVSNICLYTARVI